LDLNAGDAGNRGYQDTLSAGVNWYLNPYTRLMFDLIHEDVKRVSGLSGDANIFGMRFQVDY
jgi:phosphate-selective porin